MSGAKMEESRTTSLLRLLCDDRLDDAQSAELAELLVSSDAARRRYVETMHLCVDLADWSQSSGLVSLPHPAAIEENGKQTRQKSVAPIEPLDMTRKGLRSVGKKAPLRPTAPRHGWFGFRLRWGAAAALLLGISIWSWSHFSQSPQLPAEDQASAGVAGVVNDDPMEQQKCDRATKFVARVVEITADAQWDSELQPREFLMRLRAGDELHLLSGLAQLEFYSGARIILQGPSKFTPTGPAGGKLQSGRLTGKVEGGQFQLTTPSAKVIDLGTEFGVTVGPTSDTDVCVFDGEVEVRPGMDGRQRRQSSSVAYSLTQGMSVRVAATGKVSDGMFAGVDYDEYKRSFPSPTGANPNELDLVDIVCGGNGQGMRLAAAIDPLTGQWDRRPWNNSLGPGTRHGDRIYHPAAWHPFIDGTFVPNQFGEPVQVDTLGGVVVLPKNCGHYTWGPIWARRAVKDETQVDHSADSWGAKTYPVITNRLTRCRLGGIGIHASVGITFDLKAIGKEHPGRIDRFKGLLANLENSKEHNPEWANSNPPPSADLHVFVDGKLRYEKLNFARNIEGVPIDVDLSPNDRFLTFITTDAGNTNRYDHIVVIDPVLEIQSSNEVDILRAAVPARIGQAN